MIFVLKYWKQLSVALLALVIVTLMGTIYIKNQTINQMSSTIKVREAELALSNSSIYSLQLEITKQNEAMIVVEEAKLLQQEKTKMQLRQLLQEKEALDQQIIDILSIPETGNECKDVISLLDTIGV